MSERGPILDTQTTLSNWIRTPILFGTKTPVSDGGPPGEVPEIPEVHNSHPETRSGLPAD